MVIVPALLQRARYRGPAEIERRSKWVAEGSRGRLREVGHAKFKQNNLCKRQIVGRDACLSLSSVAPSLSLVGKLLHSPV